MFKLFKSLIFMVLTTNGNCFQSIGFILQERPFLDGNSASLLQRIDSQLLASAKSITAESVESFETALEALNPEMFQMYAKEACSEFPNSVYLQIGGELLTCNEIKALFTLSQPAKNTSKSIMEILNEALIDRNSQQLKQSLPFLKLCICAVSKLQRPRFVRTRCEADGGVYDALQLQINQTIELANFLTSTKYSETECVPYSSSSTIFLISSASAVCITDFSSTYPQRNDAEMLILPGTIFKVIDIIRREMSATVLLEEQIQPEHPSAGSQSTLHLRGQPTPQTSVTTPVGAQTDLQHDSSEKQPERNGVIVAKTISEAAALYLEGAKMEEGESNQDDVAARILYERSAVAGHPPALVALGRLFETGRGGLQVDSREAARLFRLALDLGDETAAIELGRCLRASAAAAASHGRIAAASAAGAEALALFRRAADAGRPDGLHYLGLCHIDGDCGVIRDVAEGLRLVGKAAACGSAAGQCYFGYLRHTGRYGVEPDDREAVRLFRLAAEQGSPGGLSNLGYMYQHGNGGLPQDRDAGARLIARAAAKGNAGSRFNLATLLLAKDGIVKYDAAEAGRLLRLSALQGMADAQALLAEYCLGWLREEGVAEVDLAEGVRLARLAAAQGHPRGQCILGMCHRFGVGGLQEDTAEARRLLRLSADQGNAIAMRELGLLALSELYWGDGSSQGLEGPTEEEAVALVRRAAGLNPDDALTLLVLAVCHFKGSGGLPVSHAETLRLLRLAAGVGLPYAEAMLGASLLHGWLCSVVDTQEGERLLRRAAEKGDMTAQGELGVMLWAGMAGLVRDQVEGLRLMRLAAEGGCPMAKANLAQVIFKRSAMVC